MPEIGKLHNVDVADTTGVLLSRQQVERASELCAAAGAWLVLDNTYEHFVYDGREHFCMAAPHILNIFSFSKVPPAPACAIPKCRFPRMWSCSCCGPCPVS